MKNIIPILFIKYIFQLLMSTSIRIIKYYSSKNILNENTKLTYLYESSPDRTTVSNRI